MFSIDKYLLKQYLRVFMKSKGSRTERELFHMFWDSGLAALRCAGSGSTPMPCPDLLVGDGSRVLAIECKSGKKGRRYISKEQIKELKEYATKFGAEPWVGIRYDNLDWFFLDIEDLEKSKGGNYSVSLGLINRKGLSFNELISK